MGVLVMRGLLPLLVLCSLTLQGSAQIVFEVGNIGYRIVYPSDDVTTPSAACTATATHPNVAVFENIDQYKSVIAEMIADTTNIVDDKGYYIGVSKAANDAYMRTIGGRPAPVVNFDTTSASYNSDDAGCAYLTLDRSETRAHEQSYWTLDTSADCYATMTNGDGVICTTATDEACDGNCVADNDYGRDSRFSFCFWNPHPSNVFTHLMATRLCQEGGGTLMNLHDEADFTTLTTLELVDDKQSYNRYWTGLRQEKEEGYPTWTNGKLVDLVLGKWATQINYGSSLMLTNYAGIYDARSASINLWNTAPEHSLTVTDNSPYVDRHNREALVLCEATDNNFCKSFSPDVRHAAKTVVLGKLAYNCDDGFIVPPDYGTDYDYENPTYAQRFDCTCNPEDLKNLEVKDCILRNPCDKDPCHAHSYCVFTNQYHHSYNCLCKRGYRKGADGRCYDINECVENSPCGTYYGSCYNTEGSYFCQCSRGYSWDNYGKCSATGIPGSATMTIYFHVGMVYDSDMNNPSSDIHRDLDGALRDLLQVLYGGRVTLESFYVTYLSSGSIKIKLVLALYTDANLKELSRLSYQFYALTLSSRSFIVGSNSYPFLSSVYFESPSVPRQYLIDSICSLYDGLDYCHDSPCYAEGEYPACKCRDGYEGEYCDRYTPTLPPPPPPPPRPYVTQVEMGLIAGMVVLFLMVFLVPTVILCCCIRFPVRSTARPSVSEVYTQGPALAVPRKFYGVRRPFF